MNDGKLRFDIWKPRRHVTFPPDRFCQHISQERGFTPLHYLALLQDTALHNDFAYSSTFG